MTANQSKEARELALVDKVEFRIALAQEDSKLESILNTYLCPLLLKLASEHVSVRNKIIAICQHINTRISSQSVKLPIQALLKQFKDHPDNALIRHFDLLYIQQNFSKLDPSGRAELLPIIVCGISVSAASSSQHNATLFNLLLRVLPSYKLPIKGSREDDEFKDTLNVTPEDTAYLSLWFSKLLLFRLSSRPTPDTASAPGLSNDEVAFLSLHGKPGVWDPSSSSGLNLTDTKTNVLKLLASGLFSEDERFFPALFASADPNSRVSDEADDILKRSLTRISLDRETMIDQLFDLYFGVTRDSSGGSSRVPRPRVPILTKILTVLSRTTHSLSKPNRLVDLINADLIRDPDPSRQQESKLDREVMKLRAALVSYVAFAARQTQRDLLSNVGKSVVEMLRGFLDQDSTDSRSLESKSIRGRCFEVIGTLAGTDSQLLLEPELSLLRWLFRSLKEEHDRDVVVSIDEAIGSTITPLERNPIPEVQQSLRALLLENMQSRQVNNSRNLHFASVRIANRCLPYSDVVARWIDILAITAEANQSHEIVEEGRKGLDAYSHVLFAEASDAKETQTQLAFPQTGSLIEFIFLDQDEARNNIDISALAVSFCRQTLIYEALRSQQIKLEINAEWERKLELAASDDLESRNAIKTHLKAMLKDQRAPGALVQLWQAALRGMKAEGARSKASFARFILELCSLGPHMLLRRMSTAFRQLEPAMLSNDVEVRTLSAHSYGLLASQPGIPQDQLQPSADLLFTVATQWKEAVGANSNRVHGSMLGLAFFTSRTICRGNALETASTILKGTLPIFIDVLKNSRDTLLQEAASVAIHQLCLYQAVGQAQIEDVLKVDELVKAVAEKASAGNERSITALGSLAMILDEVHDKHTLDEIINKTFQLHELRQAETQFAVGEAFAHIACGWQSKDLRNAFDMDIPLPSDKSRDNTKVEILERILKESHQTTKPALKRASVIWLLCLLEFCGDQQEVQNRLPLFQRSFKRCLSDRDELIQESAARGLGLVYERGSRDLKDDLVRDLVGSFSSEKADMSGSVTADTQLFDAGTLPTGDGSVQTYKDVMSLASEVGDPSLVYRFMSLASHNAIWSSRAAFGRFGLSNVFSDSSVEGYLSQNPKLYPKLYRYRFDPNSNVRRSMNDIWTALVKDSAAAVDANFDSIMTDLLASMTAGREWRSRQASCAALADLVQGRKMERLQQYLEEIWKNAFLLCDDIKDSVRKVAVELTRVLTNMLIRNLEATEGASGAAEDMLRLVIPFLLSTSGLEAKAEDVRALSLHTVLEIVKKGKPRTLRPFIPELVERLLGLLSTLESEVVNYVYLNASKYNLKEHEIDDLRLKAIRSSPVMEAVERCLDMLDDATMRDFVQRIQEVIKSAVGMPTKAGCSRVLVSLSTRKASLVRPYADTLLRAVEKRLIDRNETVSSSYAAALGYLARGASDGQILRVLDFAKGLYFTSEEDRYRINSGEAIQAVAKHATDRFTGLASAFLPFVFVAKHDEVKAVQQVFSEIWTEHVGGPRATSLYLGEIVALSREHLESKRWTLKHAAALAIAGAIAGVSETHGQIDEASVNVVWEPLTKALAEKTWSDKATVLKAFALLVEKCPDETRARLSSEIHKIAVREAKRRNKEYQPDALEVLGRVSAAVKPPADLFDDLIRIANEAVQGGATEEEGEGQKDETTLKRNAASAALAGLFSSIAARSSNLAHGVLAERTTAVLDLALRAATIHAHPDLYGSIFAGIKRLLDALPGAAASVLFSGSSHGASSPIFGQIQSLLLRAPPDVALPERLALAQADAVVSLANAYQASSEPPDQLLELVDAAIATHNMPTVRATLSRARQVLLLSDATDAVK